MKYEIGDCPVCKRPVGPDNWKECWDCGQMRTTCCQIEDSQLPCVECGGVGPKGGE